MDALGSVDPPDLEPTGATPTLAVLLPRSEASDPTGNTNQPTRLMRDPPASRESPGHGWKRGAGPPNEPSNAMQLTSSTQTPKPSVAATRPRKSGRRRSLAATAYAFTITMLTTTLPTPLYDIYRHRFGFSPLMVTVIFATYALGVIASLLLFGRMSDEVGRKPMLLAGLMLSAAGMTAFLIAHNVLAHGSVGCSAVSRPESSSAPLPRPYSIWRPRTAATAPPSCQRSPRWVDSAWARCWRGWSRTGPLLRCESRIGWRWAC